jgi:hypothetical protein
VNDLLDRSWDIGFSDEHKHRLNDLHELQKDRLKRDKLSEIDNILTTIKGIKPQGKPWTPIKRNDPAASGRGIKNHNK